ncbi:hypothetical protein [Curvibacter lanceolatus]|uniref:hypothetical protein n=1 Tax=Curvibacter lanceolatus TaxID=86182 RepID=UPI000360896A|nr:hypothetical protein [Curvibacter lanceolatus]
MTSYQLLLSGCVQRGDGAIIPSDEANTDYQAFLAWMADGNRPAPVPVPTLAEARALQVQAINDACQAALATITAPYPPSEALTWDQQLAEAQAYAASSSASTPMLSAICVASGKALAELAARVLALNAQFKAAVGAAIGKRQALTAQIKAATTVEEVQAIAW